DVEIERLRQRVRELEINPFDRYERQYEETPTNTAVEEYENEEDGPDSRARGDRFYHNHRSVDRGNEKVDHDPGNISEINGLRRRETESEPIIWDIGDEEKEYPFVNKYPSLQEPSMLVEEESCPVYDTDNEEESEVIYDTNGNDVDDSLEFEILYPDQGESLVIQRVLSVAPSKSIDDDSWWWNNIFRTKYNSKDKVCNMINDGGSCENAVSTYMVEKLALKTVDHPEPYQFTWLKKRNAIKVSKRCLVEFSARRKYKDKVWCEVIPMDACHILLGFKKIKVRGRIIIMKGKLMQGIQMWMLRV
nr:reverse transcriptase domain-containing protein [Tanacetum cinerariifolium]